MIQQYLQQLQNRLMPWVTRIEESPLFERAVLKFESLDPQHQRWVKGGGTLLTLLLLSYFLLAPTVSVLSAKGDLARYRTLLAEMQEYNSRTEVVEQPAPRPSGWQDLPTANVDEAESSLKQYLGSMGVDTEDDAFSRSGNDFRIAMREVTVRQLSSFSFQLDGWHPRLKTESMKIRVNSTNKDLLDVDLRVSYHANAPVGSAAAANTGRASPARPVADDFEEDVPDEPRRPSPPGGNGNSNAAPLPGEGGPSSAPAFPAPGAPEMMDNAEDLLPPPPPPIEEDVQ